MFIKPDFDINSIYDLDIYELKRMGVNALLFDLDSTIMKSRSGKFAYKTLQYLNDLKTNFKLAIVTNNSREGYLQKVKAQTDIPIYHHAKKPAISKILKACSDLNVDVKNTAIVGDRPLSDILAGKRAGIVTILVDSISKDEENPIVRFVRFLERLVIKHQDWHKAIIFFIINMEID